MIEATKPSIEGPHYVRIKVGGEWFTVPAALLESLK